MLSSVSRAKEPSRIFCNNVCFAFISVVSVIFVLKKTDRPKPPVSCVLLTGAADYSTGPQIAGICRMKKTIAITASTARQMIVHIFSLDSMDLPLFLP